VYRFERSGTLHGLLRVRGFTQDDAHVFCAPEQLGEELARVLEFADFMMRAFGYTYTPYLATRPEKSLGTDAEWERSIQALRDALEERQMKYEVEEGAGAFYGPKIDLKLQDSLGREWTGPTIQVDLNLPKRFNVTYVSRDDVEREVVMVHRTVLGSMERFIGGLLEHYAGAFPTWLAPEQVRVIPISSEHGDYATTVFEALSAAGIRASVDRRNEKTGAKIRDATIEKTPYMLILGDREVAARTVAVRKRKAGDQGSAKLADFVAQVAREAAQRA
jgi:threonyl-tRNA synthetase